MDLVLAARFMNRFAADAACSALQGSGIDARVFDDFIPGVMGLSAGEASGVRVMVPADQFEKAAALLAASEAGADRLKPATPRERFARLVPILFVPGVIVIVVLVRVLKHWLER